MSRFVVGRGRSARHLVAISAAAALVAGCSVSDALGTVSGAADLVKIGAMYEFSNAGQVLDVERMEDALDVMVIADEVSDVAGEGAEAAAAVEPLIEYMTKDE